MRAPDAFLTCVLFFTLKWQARGSGYGAIGAVSSDLCFHIVGRNGC
jgi:hypothetical protein